MADPRTDHGTHPVSVRPVVAGDRDRWRPLWDGYNAFYGRSGPTALSSEITDVTWSRFLDVGEPVHALVALDGDELVGLAHFLYHRSTITIAATCYLQDLFTAPAVRGAGIGRTLIDAVSEHARAAGAGRVYWHTRYDNRVARTLYDQLATSEFAVYSRPLS